MKTLEQTTLSWVNWIRGRVGGDYLSELPKGVPGSSRHCVVARAITMGVRGVAEVNVSGGGVELICEPDRHRFDPYDRPRYVKERAPAEVGEFVKLFDNGELPHLVDPQSRDHRVEKLQGIPVMESLTMEKLQAAADKIGPPPGLAMLKPMSTYYAPDWAKMLTPAPVTVREKTEA